MAEKFDDMMLDDLFAAAKADARMAPSPELLTRVLQEAQSLQAEQQAAPVAAPEAEAGFWQGVLQSLGGWPSLSGVALAGMFGAWIGISSGMTLMQDTLGLDLYDTGAQAYLWDLDMNYALNLGVEDE